MKPQSRPGPQLVSSNRSEGGKVRRSYRSVASRACFEIGVAGPTNSSPSSVVIAAVYSGGQRPPVFDAQRGVEPWYTTRLPSF